MTHDLSRHLSNDELLERMYLGESGPHLEECAECASRLQALEQRRTEVGSAAVAAESGISGEVLAAQRRAFYARLDQPVSVHARWAPAALAAVFLLVMGVFLVRPHPQYHQVRPPDPVVAADSSNEKLFSDLYSMEQSLEPQAAAPIHALFEVSDGDLEQ
jgi:hypothetical protein